MAKGNHQIAKVEYRPLAALVPNPKNPRKAPEGAVEKLAESIKENPKFFEARPILLSDRTGELVIIGGERRSEAARLLGMEEVPTILLQGLTEAQEDEIMVKDNTHAGEWDKKKLDRIKALWGKRTVGGWDIGEAQKKMHSKGESASEMRFTEVLNEEHNYVVLYCDNLVDWVQLCTLLGLEKVKAYSSRLDGELNEGNTHIGIGRVMRAGVALNRLRKAFKDENIG